jgi:predicted permease
MRTGAVSRFLDRLRLRFSEAPERGMDEEMRFHLEMATRRNIERGLPPDEARRKALAAFGGVRHHQESAVEATPRHRVDQLRQDLRYAARTLRRNPGFTTSIVLTLALGIGANTAIFSVVNGVLLRPLPVPDPERLAFVGWEFGPGGFAVLSNYTFDYLRRHTASFVGLTAYRTTERELGDGTDSRFVSAVRAGADFFQVMGVAPTRGRGFLPEEYREGGPDVAVLSDGLWRSAFGADSTIVGREIRYGGASYTVVGILPPTFRVPGLGERDVGLVIPYAITADPTDNSHNTLAIARIRADRTREQAIADLDAATHRFRAEHPDLAKGAERYLLLGFQDIYVRGLERTLWMLLGAVTFVLLIAAANAANLLLGRAAAREREIMVRAALGASRGRIVMQLLSEGVTITALAGTVGLAIGMWGLKALLALSPTELPRADEIGLDHRVLLFTLAIVAVTGIVFGLAAALPSNRLNLAAALGERLRSATGSAKSRDLLVMAETAFAIVLLAGAGLLIASFAKLRAIDPGFDPDGVVAVRFSRMPEGYGTASAAWNLERQLLDEIRAIPGVTSAAGLSSVPLRRGYNIPVAVTGSNESLGDTEYRAVTPGYFETLRIELTRGRTFLPSDDRDAPRVAIVNAALARRFFPGQDPLGRHLDIGRFEGKWMSDEFRGSVEIVGISADVREIRLDRPAKATVLIPLAQAHDGMLDAPMLVVRSAQPTSLAAGIETAIQRLDRRIRTPTIESVASIVDASTADRRFQTTLLSLFAGSALVLTAIGIFGVVSYGVQRRVRELGVRIALGAQRRDVIRLVVGRSLRFVIIGAVVGVLGAIGLTRFLSSALFGVTATDPLTFGLAVAVLLGIALLASYLPARRATRIDPAVALRLD